MGEGEVPGSWVRACEWVPATPAFCLRRWFLFRGAQPEPSSELLSPRLGMELPIFGLQAVTPRYWDCVGGREPCKLPRAVSTAAPGMKDAGIAGSSLHSLTPIYLPIPPPQSFSAQLGRTSHQFLLACFSVPMLLTCLTTKGFGFTFCDIENKV